MTRTIQVSQQVNANVKRDKLVDIDQQSSVVEVGLVPDAVNAYVVATEYGDSLFHKTVLTCTAVPISFADDGGVAQYGGVKLYTFPEGLIVSQGAMTKGALTMPAPFIDAFTGVNALGNVTASTGATLISTEATWLQSTANATASSKVAAISSVSVAAALTESSGRCVNGTSTPAPLFLNFAIADDVAHDAGTGLFTGVVTIVWCKVGDL
ncbi:MAG: hypothetical protein WC322_02670 [Candidatus Paceibacterota bacterium]|jgi:hypothetical protein